MNILLFQPEIPQNTGTIARTCAVTGSSLILVRPLGFSLGSRHLKRAGLDYWGNVSVTVIDDLAAYLETTNGPFYFFSSKATLIYTEITYTPSDSLIFGSESSGLPSYLWERWPDRFFSIPMKQGSRCLNVASAVSIVLYEGLRQQKFNHLIPP